MAEKKLRIITHRVVRTHRLTPREIFAIRHFIFRIGRWAVPLKEFEG